MELLRFAVFSVLLCLALAGSDMTSSHSAEEYWHSIWPDTSMPKNLEYLLWSGVNDAEKDDTQYPYTSFFEEDLHAGKQMNIIFKSPYANEEQKIDIVEKDPEKSLSSQSWNALSEKSSLNQPYGVGTWKRHVRDADKSSLNQPYGVGTWKRSMVDVDESSLNQPYGVGTWKRSAADVDQSSLNQPYGVYTWKRNPVDVDKSSLNQPYGVIRGKETQWMLTSQA
ncbi:unknown seed protein USP-like [Neltuma alba]|uniref:unknown seed protein USP-like n=1 Tax=Neltuma alba TaxID=207710 RepID=UPI0010A38670|nr:unknown seed protein USP-like [Prosopis alba]